jgi:hypothetical protein
VLDRLRSRLTYANVMATAAFFLALAGGTTAIALSGKNSVRKDDIAKNAVRGDDIAKNAVGTSEVAPGSLKSGDILDGTIGTADQAEVPVARVLRDTSVAIVDNDLTTVDLDTETTVGNDPAFDPFHMWDASNPDDVIVPADGVYLIIAEVQWGADDTDMTAGNDPGYRQITLSAPGIVPGRSRIEATAFESELTEHQASGIANLQAGDDVSVAIGQENSDASTVTALEVHLEVAWLGPGV